MTRVSYSPVYDFVLVRLRRLRSSLVRQHVATARLKKRLIGGTSVSARSNGCALFVLLGVRFLQPLNAWAVRGSFRALALRNFGSWCITGATTAWFQRGPAPVHVQLIGVGHTDRVRLLPPLVGPHR